ncbi:host attachment protein [Guyparkeria sp. 1SP6A2]|nr:host attachment protein [Guyparkeria sp. 1SP6A2]
MNTWVVVADDGRARFLEVRDNPGAYLGSQAFPSSQPAPKGELVEITSLSNSAARLDNEDLVTDRPGSTTDRKGDAMHAYRPANTAKDTEAKRFARDVVSRLDQARQDGKMDRFYLLAAPNFLGLLRDEMDDALAEVLVAQTAKDLTLRSTEEIRSALPQRL